MSMPMSPGEDQPKSKGIFITEGADFTIHGLRISLGPEGGEVSHAGVSLRQDLCRYWLRIAVGHAKDASRANEELRAAEEKGVEKALAGPLEREFRASMQAAVSAAVALDAFYAQVKDRVDLPTEQVAGWKRNRTARWKQMAEVFRFAFSLKPEGVEVLRDHLEAIAKYRDWAVHPPAESRQPVLHPDISRGVEWRFMAFRRHNAIELTRAAVAIVYRLIGKVEDDSALGKYCKGLRPALENIVDSWINHFPEHPATAAQHEARGETAEPGHAP